MRHGHLRPPHDPERRAHRRGEFEQHRRQLPWDEVGKPTMRRSRVNGCWRTRTPRRCRSRTAPTSTSARRSSMVISSGRGTGETVVLASSSPCTPRASPGGWTRSRPRRTKSRRHSRASFRGGISEGVGARNDGRRPPARVPRGSRSRKERRRGRGRTVGGDPSSTRASPRRPTRTSTAHREADRVGLPESTPVLEVIELDALAL